MGKVVIESKLIELKDLLMKDIIEFLKKKINRMHI
jgi:hypothetical protein